LKGMGKEELHKAAEVIKIELSSAEMEQLEEEFSSYLKWLEPLLALDCNHCEPLRFGCAVLNVMREDQAEQKQLQEVQSCAANFEDGFYLVPPIIE
jgi:aspartyl/glutamyl-tRNA(Asn/Gln) amidotransferase C subunit